MKNGLGYCNLKELREAPLKQLGSEVPVKQLLGEIQAAGLNPRFSEWEIQAWVGFWCADTVEHFPGFLGELDSCGFPSEQIGIFSLDSAKKCPSDLWVENEKSRLRVKFLPTFIFFYQGQEVGRIVESPAKSISEDVREILAHPLQKGHKVTAPSESLQTKYSPKSICFGCGPANESGLKIQSIPDDESGVVRADWRAKPYHEAFPGMLNGGIIGSLLDCHSNWTAAWHLMKQAGLDQPPCTVTADYAIKLLRPTPSHGLIRLTARVKESKSDRATIEAQLFAGEKLCATCIGTFVAVKPGHPAYHRW